MSEASPDQLPSELANGEVNWSELHRRFDRPYWELDPAEWTDEELNGEEHEWYLAFAISYGRDLVSCEPTQSYAPSLTVAPPPRPEDRRQDSQYEGAIAAILAA